MQCRVTNVLSGNTQTLTVLRATFAKVRRFVMDMEHVIHTKVNVFALMLI